MAGDWIKMRADLFSHPKVVRMASALKADNLRTVGGLMSAWCLFDAHSIDGELVGYTSETLDEYLRWPGFAAAMIWVGWLADDGQALVLPEFDTHNGASAKRRAQDADRKKTVRNLSASEADVLRTREEKRREEKKEKKDKAPAGAEFLGGVEAKLVRDFLAIRRAKRLPFTESAANGFKLEVARAGMELEAAIRLCCTKGWAGFEASWLEGKGKPAGDTFAGAI